MTQIKDFSNKTIFKTSKPEDNFTQIRNEILTDNRLNSNAKIMLILMLSKPHDYTINTTYIAKEAGLGDSARKTAIKQLEKAGYFSQKKVTGNGKVEWHNIVKDYCPSDHGTKTPPGIHGTISMGGKQPNTNTHMNNIHISNNNESTNDTSEYKHWNEIKKVVESIREKPVRDAVNKRICSYSRKIGRWKYTAQEREKFKKWTDEEFKKYDKKYSD